MSSALLAPHSIVKSPVPKAKSLVAAKVSLSSSPSKKTDLASLALLSPPATQLQIYVLPFSFIAFVIVKVVSLTAETGLANEAA